MVDNEWTRCASCDIEIWGSLLVVEGIPFCCPGCAEGGPCTCTYEGDQALYPPRGPSDLMLALERLEDGL